MSRGGRAWRSAARCRRRLPTVHLPAGNRAGAGGLGPALVLPDIATCGDCLREIFDPRDRRYRYPFTNCTKCGPRFSIIEALPYDRPSTSMKSFVMCEQCRAEYENPRDVGFTRSRMRVRCVGRTWSFGMPSAHIEHARRRNRQRRASDPSRWDSCRQRHQRISPLVSHVLVPLAMEAILSSPHCRVQGFLAAGHVLHHYGFHRLRGDRTTVPRADRCYAFLPPEAVSRSESRLHCSQYPNSRP